MRFPMMWAVARSEMRSTRRLARYWVFSILAILIAFLTYIYYGAIHANFSHMTPIVGATGPRFLVAAMGLYCLIAFLIGLVFLAFDVRARDVRDRMAEVLDARPLTNLEFVVGRGVGVALMAFIPMVFLALLLQSFGGLAIALDWPVGEPVEPLSLIGLLVDATAVFLLWSALVVFLAVLIKSRLIVAVAALTIIGLQMWGFIQAPIYLQSVIGFISGFLVASDVLPAIATLEGLAQRLVLVVFAIGLFFLAAALHPRQDGERSKGLRVGLAAVAVAAIGLFTLGISVQSQVDQTREWSQAHSERSDTPRVDVKHVAGSVTIDPGSELSLDLILEVVAPEGRALDTLLFTLNPGVEIEAVRVDGDTVAFTHENGLFDIEHPLAAGESSEVELVAAGSPHTQFGYFESAINFLEGAGIDANIVLLGVEVGVFDSRYVALTPGNYWLPSAGTAVPLGDARTHPPDYFTLDLEVSIPQDWKVAGPGAREQISAGTYRYRQSTPLPAFGLFASEFVSHEMRIGSIDFEVLMHESHQRNLEFFSDAGEELRLYLEEKLMDADRYGLTYPYGALSLVEVPSILRGYDGGWRMDTTMALPGLMLVRETSFPTARFDAAFDDTDEIEAEMSVEKAKVLKLAEFFSNDVSGGNVFLGGTRNFFSYQTSATGTGAVALNFVTDELLLRLLDYPASFFSAHIFRSEAGFVIGETIFSMVSGQSESISEAVRNSAANRPSVWDTALGTPLAELDLETDPQSALNVLSLKSGAIAESIVLAVGKEQTAAILKTLLARHRGSHFTADDFDDAAKLVGVDLQAVIGDWLHDAALPGFVTSPVKTRRLQDDERGNPQYQTSFHVRNDETTPGLVVFSVRATSEENQKAGLEPRWDRVGPYRLQGKESLEVGIITDQPVSNLTMHPFLALNRNEVSLRVPRVEFEERISADPFLGTRPSEWRLDQTDDIYVDDLDDGFVVSGTPPVVTEGSIFTPPIDLDQGLPELKLMFGMPDSWSRQENDTSWGKYRHTVAVVGAGDGTEIASFNASLPEQGRWRLEYHIPNMSGRDFNQSDGNVQISGQFGPRLGMYDIKLKSNGEDRPIEFDGAAAEIGWNRLGDFDMSAGDVELVVTNSTAGGAVVADAIRWSPLGS